MKFQISLAALLAASQVSAGPTTSTAFTLTAAQVDSPVDSLIFSAASSTLFLNLPEQNAVCQHPVEDEAATLYIRDGQLYLYATKAAPQIIYTDRSGMGQGKIGYATLGQDTPENAEFKGWALDENDNLKFDGAEFLACPSVIEGAWSVWVSVGIHQPGGNEDCVTLSAKAVENPKPISCHYS